MGYLVHAYYSISPTRYYKDDSWWSIDLKSKATEDIISIGSFMEVLILNHYVLVRKILKTNTTVSIQRKIRRIRACTHQRPQRKQDQYAVSSEDQYAVLEITLWNYTEDNQTGSQLKKPNNAVSNTLDTPMDDPNITMKEYIRLKEEKAHKCEKVFNWETAKYGRIWYDEDGHNLKSIENEFPAIAFNDSLKSGETLSCEPTVSYLNDEIDFKISFDDSHDEDYMEGLQYTDTDIVDFETRLARIYKREVHRVHVFDIGGLPDLMVEGLSARMLMEHRDAHGEMEIGGLSAYWAESARQIPNKGDLRDYWIEISSARDFLGIAPSYTSIRDPILRPCHRSIACNIAQRSQAHEKVTDLFYLRRMDVGSVNVPYLLARYLRLFALGRNHGVMISRGKLVRLLICKEIDNTWAWVALGPERQPDAAASAHGVVQDAPVVDEGDRDVRSLRGLMERSMTNHVSSLKASLITRRMLPNTSLMLELLCDELKKLITHLIPMISFQQCLEAKKYPLSQDTLSKMLSRRLEVDHQSEMGYELTRRKVSTASTELNTARRLSTVA
ncbi:hypothetical protein Tco_1360929 [Tanacetum coccineum]